MDLKKYLTVAIMSLSLQSIAQKNNSQPDHPQFKRLYIGDTLSMESIAFNNVRNYPGGKAILSDFKGKNIILDFWNKGCSSCIEAFPHMEELQKQFKDDIQILLVTQNTEEELALLFKNSKNVKETKLPMILGEGVLTKKLFPNGSVPYHVWINKEGKVMATTFQNETTPKNLKDFIAGRPLNLLIKNELEISESLNQELWNGKISLLKVGNGLFLNNVKYYAQVPLPRVPNAPPEPASTMPALPYYSMFMKGLHDDFQIGHRGLGNLINEKGSPMGFRSLNLSIKYFYIWAFLEKPDFSTKIIPEGGAKLLYEEVTDSTNMKRYSINNIYCYESILPNYTFENAKTLLRQDLIRFFGMKGDVEERPIKHLILTRLDGPNEKKLWAKKQLIVYDNLMIEKETKNSFYLENSPALSLYGWISKVNQGIDDPIIIDETKFTDTEKKRTILMQLDCGLQATPENIPRLKKELAKYGFGLKEEIRKTKVLVLRSTL